MTLQSALPGRTKIFYAMPNTPVSPRWLILVYAKIVGDGCIQKSNSAN